MRLLAIDKGNSRIKMALQKDKEDPVIHYFDHSEPEKLLQQVKNEHFDASVMSSVVAGSLTEVSGLLASKGKFVSLDSNTPLPVGNKYATPETLGADRIAGAVGAWIAAGKKDVLLMDAGTCVNYEFITENNYLGGAIAPGLRMRLRSMHEFTGKLPLLELPQENLNLRGNSTATCMLSGAVWGLVKEMEGVASHYSSLYPGIQIILSGGDSAYLGKYLKNGIFAPRKEMVITGLLEILKYNLND